MAGINLFDVVSGKANLSDAGMNLQNTAIGKTSTGNEFSKFISNISKSADITGNTASSDITQKTSVSTVKQYSDQIKSESVNPLKQKIDNSKDSIEDFQKQVVDAVAEELDVESDDVQKVMDELGLCAFDLLNPQNLAELTSQLKGVDDTSLMILDENFQAALSDLMEIGQNFMEELDITADEMTELVSMMDVSDTDTGDELLSGLTNDSESEPSSAILQENTVTESGVINQNDVTKEISDNIDSTSDEVTNIASEDFDITSDESVGDSTITDTKLEVENDTSDDSANLEQEEDSESYLQTGNSVEESLDDTSKTNVDQFANEIRQTADVMVNTNQVTETPLTDAYISVDTMDIIDQIVQSTKVTIDNEVSTMEMQLNPEKLGKIYLNVTSREGNINAQLAVSNEAVKEALESQIATLKENLNQAGVKVDAVEVTVSSHEFERNLEQNHSREEQEGSRQEESASRRRNIQMSSLDELSGVMSEEETLVAQMMIDNGNSVDLTA